MQRIIIALEPFLISNQCIIGLYKLIFNRASSIFRNLNHMVSHGLSPVGLGSDLKDHIMEATRMWQVKHEFSDCRCDTVFITYKDKFLTKGCIKNKI